SNHAISDTIDSDALLVNGTPTIRYTTGGPGQNNHGLDFGFFQPPTGQVDMLNTAPLQQEYDLALRKRVINQTANPDGSRVATYAIEIFNQGDVAASNIELVDYLPANATLGTPTNGWIASGSNLSLTVLGPIAPGDSTTVDLLLNIGATAAGRWVTNTAEIAVDDGDDIDSTPDTTNNDALVDDVINDNPTTGTDEDDHDIAVAPPICPVATIWNGGVYNDNQGAFVTNVEGLDWSSAGSGVFEGIGPIGTSAPTGTQFTLRYQAVLVGLTDPSGNAVLFNGLNMGFEYTIVAEIPMIVVDSQAPIPGLLVQAFATLPGGQFQIYIDASQNQTVASGFGFDDGILVASGYVDCNQSSTFLYNSSTSGGNGAFIFNAPLTYVNPAYIDPTDKLAEFRL
ncbi:MAG: DUF11 domain-containing protein, partial [Caldilineaceae bacterium]|nr:DUF11 domain-containing protein [Caldilineaceae bacterium]